MDSQELGYTIKRHDLSTDKSLQPYSAADEYLLQRFNQFEPKPAHTAIYNDRFGFLGCNLNAYSPLIVLTQKSQEKAITANFEANGIAAPSFTNPLAALERTMDLALVKIPKSIALFQLFLEHIVQNSTPNVTVVCAFMLRHFSPNLLQVASQYFDVVEQSLAQKKARLLVLTQKKSTAPKELLTTLEYKGRQYKQYWGVFSLEHIDYATQFFLQHMQVTPADECILDLASGNGIIGNEIHQLFPSAEVHLMDDSLLAVESAKLNIQGENIHHHLNNDLSIFGDNTFDLIVTNPPFHFDYEINIQVPLQLFRESYRCLKPGGNLQIVANKHLNYKTHLAPLFSRVDILNEDGKFIIYRCVK